MNLDRLIKFITSLRLAVACLALGVLLVFFGTLAQVDEGLYQAQGRWFRSFLVWWGPQGASWKIPIFPGGYLIGGVLLLNLIATHIKGFQKGWKKLGIHVIHAGIILLILGQLATDLLSRETQIRFLEGETRNFSEKSRDNELVFMTDAATPGQDEVVAIPESMLAAGGEIRHEMLPFTILVREYHKNAMARLRAPMFDTNPPAITNGLGAQYIVEALPEGKSMDDRDMPDAFLTLTGKEGSLGDWVVSTDFTVPQEFQAGGRIWRMQLRWTREYLPFSVQLLKTRHDVYPGTDVPKNFQSRVRIENPGRGENREVDIYMNNPLRYQGLTFYQYQMKQDELQASRTFSALQVVHNPSWLTPYLACLMVGGGMAYHFMMHLVGFISKRRIA
jgi:hypothetical protein